MEALRIAEELQKQKYTPSHHHTFNRMSDQAAIGMVDLEMLTPGGDPGINRLSAPECSGLKKTALSNSLIDLTDGKNLRYFVQENRVRKCTWQEYFEFWTMIFYWSIWSHFYLIF